MRKTCLRPVVALPPGSRFCTSIRLAVPLQQSLEAGMVAEGVPDMGSICRNGAQGPSERPFGPVPGRSLPPLQISSDLGSSPEVLHEQQFPLSRLPVGRDFAYTERLFAPTLRGWDLRLDCQ